MPFFPEMKLVRRRKWNFCILYTENLILCTVTCTLFLFAQGYILLYFSFKLDIHKPAYILYMNDVCHNFLIFLVFFILLFINVHMQPMSTLIGSGVLALGHFLSFYLIYILDTFENIRNQKNSTCTYLYATCRQSRFTKN
jgi:hypothetical protein